MENKKVLKITCYVCDARKVQESTLAAYERIEIVCDILLAGPEAKKLLANYAVSVTADQVLDLEGEVRISSVNGAAEIHPGQVLPDGKWFLTVNGNLDIAPSSEDVLKSYLGISVNGSVTCPQSLAALLSAVSVRTSPLHSSVPAYHAFPSQSRVWALARSTSPEASLY